MKLFRKNQVIVTTLAVMLAVGGYLSFSLQEEQSENSGELLTFEISDEDVEAQEIFTDTEESDEDEVKDPGSAVLASATAGYENYVAKVKLNREQVRAKSKETLQSIIDNSELSEESKAEAVSALVELTRQAEQESDIEMLLEAKGFSNVVVSILNDSVDVVVNMDGVTDAMRAQIEDIIKRKTDVPAENIVITPLRSGQYEE